jgi:hypothetical protein
MAAVEEISQFVERCGREAKRLEIPALAEKLSVLGNGTEWVWNLGVRPFLNANEVLDSWHLSRKVGALGNDGGAFGGVLNYFAGHQERSNYALRQEQLIGGGLVEGSIKRLFNKRLKRIGAL